MALYRLSGELIESSLPLDDYAAVVPGGPPTVTVHVAAARLQGPATGEVVNRFEIGGEPFLTVTRADRAHRVRIHGFADFEVRGDGVVTCIPMPHCELPLAAQLFVDRVLPNLLSRSRPALHASVVAIDGRAAAFLGDSGRGKSTLASALTPPGTWMCDDCAVLRIHETQVLVEPSYPFARLYRDSLDALDERPGERASTRTHKWRTQRVATSNATPLRAVFSIAEPSDRVHHDATTRRDAMAELARHLYRLDPLDRHALTRELAQLDTIAERVPVFHLHYPREFSRLPEVRALILRLVSSV